MINIKVAEIMGKRKMTKKNVADSTGIRPATVGNLWKGATQRLEIEHLNALCKVLQCQPGDLLEYIPDSEDTAEGQQKV